MRKFSAQDKCMKCRYYCKKFIAFLFSHVGLCGLVVAYVILGAITFSYLEADYERMVKVRVQGLHNGTIDELWNVTHAEREPMGDLYVQENPFPPTNILLDIASSKILKRKQLEQARRAAAQDLWNITLEMNVLFEKNWTALVNERILQYQNQLMDVLLNDSLASQENATATLVREDYNETQLHDLEVHRLRGILLKYEREILQEVRQHGYDGDADTSPAGTVQWSVAGGLLYSLTVITTIGYGHITPKTIWGKLITMLYAIIGIPLMLLCLANIGDALAHAFKFFYWKICCLYCEIKKRRKRLMRIQSVRMSRKSHRSSANTMLSNNVGPNSLHTSFKVRPPSSGTLKSQDLKPAGTGAIGVGGATLGTGHNTLIRITSDDGSSPTPSPTHGELQNHNGKLLGESPNNSGTTAELATTSNDPSSDVTTANNSNATPHETIINFSIEGTDPSAVELRKLPPMAMDDEYGEGVEDEKLMIVVPAAGVDRRKMSVCNMPPETIDGIDYVDETPQQSPQHLSPDENTAVIIHDVHDDESHIGDFEPRYEKVSVPVYICLLVVFGYILGGSILFASWEGWDILDGAYFCFITLTTIGFGDFVPGVSSSGDFTNNSEEKLTLCSLYLVFGMALLAMSFNLVQEAATEKAKWIGRKLGILGDESDEDD